MKCFPHLYQHLNRNYNTPHPTQKKSFIMNNSRQIQLSLQRSKLQTQEQILLSTYTHSLSHLRTITYIGTTIKF